MSDLHSILLDLDEDLERLSRGLLAAEAVSAAIALNHTYGDGLYAVCDYLGQAHRDLRRDLDRCLDQARAVRSLPQ